MKKLFPVLLVICAFRQLSAADFIVTNTNDSGPGSLRQAMTDANSSGSGPNPLIKFQIPGTGVHTINLVSALPAVPAGIIDGYTQPGARPNSMSVGTDAVLLVEVNASAVTNHTALQFGAFNSVVRGLVLNGDVLISNRNSNQVSGCYIGTNAGGTVSTASGGSVKITGNDLGSGNIIGGPTPADRNIVATSITISGNAPFSHVPGNTIQGNYVGVAADGKTFFNPSGFVSAAHSDNNTIGGSTAGAGNVVAGYVGLSSASGSIVQANLIGTTGMVASPGAIGLLLSGNPSGSAPGSSSNNLISQNVIVASDTISPAVSLSIATSNNVLRGNLIGVGTDGKTRVGKNRQGIYFSANFYRSVNNTIGGPNPGDGNVIMFGGGGDTGTSSSPPAGIAAIADPCHNIINGNFISGSGGLPIDLGARDVTPNDSGDADGIQNFPVLTSALFDSGKVRVTGTLNSVANTAFRIELFGVNADSSGSGRSQSHLGFTNVTTDGNGNAAFDVTLPAPGNTSGISSTATGPSGTSEFSAALFAKLLNISTRANVQTGSNIAIAGFIITGTESKTLLLRGIGPSMKVGGMPLAGRLQDPVLDLWDSSNTLLTENDNWRDSQEAEIEASGLAPGDEKEAAILMSLAPGAYTVQLSDVNGGTGIGLVEAYDLTPSASQLANISTRSLVQTGDNVMIGGFIIGVKTGRSARVLLRGIGPSLAGFSNPLQDPVIELYDTNGQLVASNDDWKTTQAAVEATGIPPTDDRESALVADLVSSAYTVVLRGKDNFTGVAVVEVYSLP